MADDSEVYRGGEFDGWRYWPNDNYEGLIGPFFFRYQEDGGVRCAFRVEPRHLNNGGSLHGGCMMSFADFALFAIAQPAMKGAPGVTVSLGGEFVSGAQAGELVECTGEIIRAGGSLIFLQGRVFSGCRNILAWSGVIKKLRIKES